MMSMRSAPPQFATLYEQALIRYLEDGGENALHEAYEYGRRALDAGLQLLNFISLHQQALANAIKPSLLPTAAQTEAATAFLMEGLSPYEMLLISNAESNAALRRLNQILEEEARRIAHTLHDEAAQMLATVYLEIAEIRREKPTRKITIHLDNVISGLDQVREQLRRLSHELRPPILDRLGLLPALRFLTEGFHKRDGLEIEICDQTATNSRFAQPIETAIYRAVQEALNNIVKHARASHAGIRIWTEDNWVMCNIIDNGIGFEPPKPGSDLEMRGLGLLGIQERISSLHGSFTIISKPGRGTELRIKVPVASES